MCLFYLFFVSFVINFKCPFIQIIQIDQINQCKNETDQTDWRVSHSFLISIMYSDLLESRINLSDATEMWKAACKKW